MRNNLSFYTLKERIFLVKTFYQSSNNVSCVKSNFLLEYGPLEEAPTDSLIFEVINLFEETGSVREIPEFFFEDKKDTFIIDEIKLEEPEIKQEEEDDADSLLLPLPEISDIWGNIEGVPQETAKKPEETPKPTPKKRIRIRQRKSAKPRIVDPDRVQYECDICQKRLVSKRGMRRHMLRHTENEEALCKYCNTMIPTGKELKVHIKEKHAKEVEDEKPTTTCHVCSKTFKWATKLKRHLISHTEKKAVVCDVCGKGFKTKCALMVHMRTHTGEKPYKCEYPNCGREFHHSTSYIIHKRCHTGEKPYACEVCGKGFADKGTLRVHYRQHTGENPYVCELCGKTTKQKQNLKSHMMHFHNIDKVFNKEYKE